MKKIILILSILFCTSLSAIGQVVTTDPVFPTADAPVTITYDATKGTSGLEGAEKVYIHTGAIIEGPNSISWTNVIGNWGADDGVGLMTQVPGTEQWQITYTPRDYYQAATDGVDLTNENIYRMGMVFRNADGTAEGKSETNGDIFVRLYQPGEYDARLISPGVKNVLADLTDTVSIYGAASLSADLSISVDGVEVATVAAGTEINYDFIVGSNLTYDVTFTAVRDGEATITDEFTIIRSVPAAEAALPAGVDQGINYIDDNTVTLVLFAPAKDFVYVIGDFNNWSVNPDYLMNIDPDGQTHWITLEGLTAGQEYMFQYLVNGEARIADPYTEVTVDRNDQFINFLVDETTPYTVNDELIDYPEGLTDGIISVFQTAQTPYNWQHDDVPLPDKQDLIIYELLIRDFVDQHDYKTVMDSLDYIEAMGVNAIELMPIMEFEGNNSWGYNPSFHTAVDKYYGPRNDLKALIDECHRRGIAVILDMVLNHAFDQSPLVQLAINDGTMSPDNPWFNVVAPHPYNVGRDFNQETEATQYFVDRVNRFWLEEYHFDGYRFDLVKGFTQNRGGNNTDDNGAYDQSRVDILTRMTNKIWEFDADAYIIFEGFIATEEENVYQEAGIMPWGSVHFSAKDAMIGNINSSDFGSIYAIQRGRVNNNMVGFFESHDEERMMFEAVNFGRAGTDYDIRELDNALNRVKMLSAFSYLVPGPKMFWMFGELGYDFELNDDRLGRKPIRWDYYDDPERLKLYKAYSAILNLRRTHENIIANATVEMDASGSTKRLAISHNNLNILVIGNWATGARNIDPDFQHTGTWYDFFTGKEVSITNTNEFYELAPGEFHIFTDQPQDFPEEGLVPYDVETVTSIPSQLADGLITIFPNPTQNGSIRIRQTRPNTLQVQVMSLVGEELDAFTVQPDGSGRDYRYNMAHLNKGVYLLRITQGTDTFTAKIINK